MRKEQKEKVVSWVRDHTADDETIIFTGFEGLAVADADELRSKIRASGSIFRVVKNTLLRLGLDGKTDGTALDGMLKGTTAVAIAQDPVALAKVLKAFSNENDALSIKGALMDGKILSSVDALKLAELPSKEQLIGQLAAMLVQPLTQLVSALSAPLRDLAGVLQQIKEAKEG